MIGLVALPVELISAFLLLVDYDLVVDADASGAGFADAGADDAVGAVAGLVVVVVGVVAADACIDVTDYWDDRK